jgi:hypothetical protein
MSHMFRMPKLSSSMTDLALPWLPDSMSRFGCIVIAVGDLAIAGLAYVRAKLGGALGG